MCPIWGIAGAPLVEGDLVIVAIGGKDNACLMAFDKATGQEKWRSMKDGVSYSAPIMIDQAKQRVLVAITDQRIVGLEPRTGQLYWEQPFVPKEMEITIATPVFDGRHLAVTSFYDGTLLLNVHSDDLGVDRLWQRRGASEQKTDALHCCISTPMILGDHLYGVDSYGELRCLDLKTGDRIWEDLTATPKARWSNIHMVRNGDKVWMFNERGELIISRLAPDGFHEISRAKLIDPTRTSSTSVAASAGPTRPSPTSASTPATTRNWSAPTWRPSNSSRPHKGGNDGCFASLSLPLSLGGSRCGICADRTHLVEPQERGPQSCRRELGDRAAGQLRRSLRVDRRDWSRPGRSRRT